MEKLTDTSIMPFGMHQGKQMANVPSDYLLYIYNEGKCTPQVRQYIIDNLDAITQDAGYTG